MKILNILLLLLLLPCLGLASVTDLVMPGPLIEGHAKVESDCNKCHGLLSKKQQRDLCLDCHKQVAADIEAKGGFHGKSPAVGESECRDCHTDHKGREADILLLDEETFDHSNSDFALQGAHRKVECDKCHNPDLRKIDLPDTSQLEGATRLKHHNAPDSCVACHQKDEPHQGLLGNKCQRCHQPEQWSKVSFQHDTAKFQLEGAHQQLSCNQCHPNQRWKGVPGDCFSCHRLNDNHAGRFGEKCQNCHSPNGTTQDSQGKRQSAWLPIGFDHNKTAFPLHEKHRKVRCELCHTGQLYEQKLKKDCISCHQTEDPHRGRFGSECQSCHQTTGWQQARYDHQQTKFPLQGKHLEVDCNKCHTGPTDGKKLALDCYSCHQLDDPHNGQQGQDCANCHNPEGWQKEVRFEHDLSSFPLIGMHAVTPCEACHTESSFKGTPRDCVACHTGDDEHNQQLGSDCATCHNPNGWNLWLFEHNAKSKFQLDGKHASLPCLDCHNKPVKDRISTEMSCASCHRKDDPHNGSFGRNCERCHTTQGFDQPRLSQ